MDTKPKEPVGYTITAELNATERIFVHIIVPATDEKMSFILQIGDTHKMIEPDEARAFIDLLSRSDYSVEDGPPDLSYANGPN